MIAAATAITMIGGTLFSLAVGTTAAACAMAFLAVLPHGVVAAIVVTIALGAVLGAVQGMLIGTIGANPIIVTIAAASAIQGVALWKSDGETVVPGPGAPSVDWLNGRILTIPVSVYVLFATVLVLDLLLRHSRFGSTLRLVGENRPAARAAGLPVVRTITLAFALAGVCVGIAGVEIGAFNGSASLASEGTLTYDAIAACIVGGIAISGGRGAVWQALGGALLIAVISDILLLRGYSEGLQILVKGIIVFVVVILMRVGEMRRAS
jgi:ribose/xylose/arabinose/galactoside ABC-type transport system permease subunit